MALRKSRGTDSAPARAPEERRGRERGLDALSRQLTQGGIDERRWAARDLVDYPMAATMLAERLLAELDLSVREAILDTLAALGNKAVVAGLLPLLRSEDAALRNGVIEVLQGLPAAVAPYLRDLLHDPDPDVRIFTIDILRTLTHPETPQWLHEVLLYEAHVNVLATAIDCLAEIGTPAHVEALQKVKDRFADQPFIGFVVDTALQRINGS